MDNPIRVLYLEDPAFSALVSAVGEKEESCVEVVSVSNIESFAAALQNRSFDLILADCLSVSGVENQAVGVVRANCPEIPFVLVSEALAERGDQKSSDTNQPAAVSERLEQIRPVISRTLRHARARLQKRQSEAGRSRQEQFLTALTGNSNEIFSIVDRDGIFRWSSSSISRVLGCDPTQLNGQSALLFVHPDDLSNIVRGFRRVLQNAETGVLLEFRFRHADGVYREIESTVRNCLDDPAIDGFVVVSRDVGERNRMRKQQQESAEALARSKTACELAQRLGQLGTWERELGVSDNIETAQLRCSAEACRILGLPPQNGAIIGESFLQLVHPADRKRVLDSIEQARRGGLPFELEYRVVHSGGKRRNIQERGICVCDPDGRVTRLSGIIMDVTEARRLEEESRQYQRLEAIGQLAGGVAHDFNNLLTVVHGHASLLLSDETLPTSALKSAGQIIEAADRAANLTRQLLAFGRRQIIQPRRLDLNRLVTNMASRLEKNLGGKVPVQVNCSPDGALAHADGNAIDHVLLSLVLNAHDALIEREQPVVKIETKNVVPDPELQPQARCGRYICLKVCDNGCGIAPENLPRIFEPFFTTKDIGKGTGLGLAAVYGIVKQHQGWIEVDSELGKGSEFRVYLPPAIETPSPAEKKKPEEPVRGGSETILVVEDEMPVRDLVCNLLTGYGYRVLRAETGVEALSLWRQRKEKIDLLLTDLVMPDRLSGRELADELRAEAPELKVIFTSGHSPDIVGKDFVLQAGLRYLQKPYDSKKLAASVRDCLDS